MRLLFISPLNPEGMTVLNRTLPLLNELTRYDYAVDVVFPTSAQDSFYKRFDKIQFICLKSISGAAGDGGAIFINALKKVFQPMARPSFGSIFPALGINDVSTFLRSFRIPNEGYDAIYVSKPLIRSAGIGLFLGKKWGIPVILDLDDYDIAPSSFLLKNFKGIVVASRELERLFKRYNTSYVPNSTDLSFYDPSRYPPKKEQMCVIVWSGVMFEFLRLETILKAFKSTHQDAKLMFMGSGPKKPMLIQYTKLLNLEGRVIFNKWVDRAFVPDLLAKSSIGLIDMSDTIFERCKCPGKMFEYMAMELPIIATDVGEPSKTIKAAKCGILVPPNNPSAIAEAMNYLIQNPGIRQEMGRRGREYLLKSQNYQSLSLVIKQFIDQIVESNSAA